MAEKAKPVKKVRFKLPDDPGAGGGGGSGGGDGAAAAAPAPGQGASSSPPRSPSPPEPFTYNFGAGSSGGGGGDGAAAAAPAPGQGPSSSPPRSPSPPEPFTYDFGAGSSGGGGGGGGAAGPGLSSLPSPLSPPTSGVQDSNDEKRNKSKIRNGWGSLFMSDPEVLSMHSSDPQNLPHYIGRQGCDPISTEEFLSLRYYWQQLLHGKKTYLRHDTDSKYADRAFVAPKPLEKALRCQEPLSRLIRGSAGKPITLQKFKILSEHYVCFRPVRSDGSQFYRAFLFSYLENLGKMQGSQAEVTRLMKCVARSRVNFRHLKWNDAYFSNPEAFFSSVVSEFEHLVNSVANGLNADELYKISLQEISSSRSEDTIMLFGMWCLFICSLCHVSLWLVLCLLRLLTEVHIRTHEMDYNRQMNQIQNKKINALSFCKEKVRPFGADVAVLQMKALSQALGIPLHAALVDRIMIGGTVQVKCIDSIPQSGPLSQSIAYYLSSATDKQPFLPPGNLFSSDSMPLVTIVVTPNATAILYRK